MHADLLIRLKKPAARGRAIHKSQLRLAIGRFDAPRSQNAARPCLLFYNFFLRELRVSALFAVRAARDNRLPYRRLSAFIGGGLSEWPVL
jgi:hypothetical protein